MKSKSFNGRKIHLIIFDLDGTLIDAYNAVSSSIAYALEKLGLPPVDDDKIKRSVGWGEVSLARALVPEEYVDELVQIYRSRHEYDLRSGVKFMPNAQELICRLKEQGYKLAIATNRASVFTNIILHRLDIRHMFSYVLCRDEIDLPKPYGQMIERILNTLGYDKDEAVYIGDMTVDVQTGINAGVKTIAVATGSSKPDEIAILKPFSLIYNISDVLEILNKLNGYNFS